MTAFRRRDVLMSASGVALLGVCSAATASVDLTPDDVAIGRADAPVTLIEYSSVMCPHCREWHETVWAQLKANYIDTGRVRYVVRELAAPAAAAAIAVAGFQLARCNGATPEQYMRRVSAIFDDQPNFYASHTMADVRSRFVTIAMNNGITEAQVMQCITDPAGAERVRRITDEATRDFQVTGTPTFVLNGRKLEATDALTYEALSHTLDAELARRG